VLALCWVLVLMEKMKSEFRLVLPLPSALSKLGFQNGIARQDGRGEGGGGVDLISNMHLHRGPLSLEAAGSVVRQILTGLGVLHARGLVHR
jgi:serine/threonine protein kinase